MLHPSVSDFAKFSPTKHTFMMENGMKMRLYGGMSQAVVLTASLISVYIYIFKKPFQSGEIKSFPEVDVKAQNCLLNLRKPEVRDRKIQD